MMHFLLRKFKMLQTLLKLTNTYTLSDYASKPRWWTHIKKNTHAIVSVFQINAK